MYLWAKILVTFIVLSILGGILYAVRDYLPGFSSTPIQTETVNTKETKNTTSTSQNNPTTNKSPKITPKPVTHPTITNAQKLVNSDNLVEARDLLWKFIKDEKLTDQDDLFWKASELLSKINTHIIFTKTYCPEKIKHKVKRGESLDWLTKRYFTTEAVIKKSNNLSSSNIRIGQSLRIYKGEWSIKAIKSKFKLILFDGDKVFKTYNIATGKKGSPSPTGTFEIVAKQKNPHWRGLSSSNPKNVLGTRWMEIRDTNPNSELEGYGIHGTKAPSSIGTKASMGCLRMHNRDVEELFDLLPHYTPCHGKYVKVTIVD